MSTFKTSINIKYDLGKTEFYNRYIPTSSHSEILKGIIDGINSKGTRAHIAIGPYGTGKSLITTLIAGIVSKSVDEVTINNLSNKFAKSDQEISSRLLSLKDSAKIIPVIFTGDEGDFEALVINRITSELDKYNIKVMGNNINLQIIETIRYWKKSYKIVFDSFNEYLVNSTYKDYKAFILNLKENDQSAINWYLTVYPEITGGNKFISIGDMSFISKMERIFETVEKNGKGLFIIYDEFGRFLQNLPENKITKTMGLLQDLAELVDHKSKNSHLLFITHKHLSNYLGHFNEDNKNEFNRIEARFKIYSIKNDQETFFDIANQIISNYNLAVPSETYSKYQISLLRKYGLFEFNQTVIENKIINGCYPIHPVSLFLLSRLSSLFGQNERTLFTFLESSGTGGLINHMEKEQGLYLAYELFDYFFSNYDDAFNDENFENIKKYFTLGRKIGDKDENKSIYKNILKFITAWEVTKSNTIQKLTTDFLSYVFNSYNIEKHLIELKELKIIRYNRIINKWELFEGSPININKQVKKIEKELVIEESQKIDLMMNLLEYTNYHSDRYNHDKSINRFTKNQIITSKQYLNNDFEYIYDKADMYIYYIVLSDSKDINNVISKLNTIEEKGEFKLFCLTNIKFKDFDKHLRRWFYLKHLIIDQDFILQDVNLKEELEVEILDSEFMIKKYIRNIQNFSHNDWYYMGVSQEDITSTLSLSNFISDTFNSIYSLTPEIKNEMINRKKVSNQQLNAAIKLIDLIIKNPLIDQFGLTGNGPDYLIYATVFKNNGFSSLESNNGIYNAGKLEILYNSIINIINKGEKNEFIDLYNILYSPPFAIRKPLIPVIMVGLLKNYWNYMMFFGKGSFIPNVDGNSLYDMINHPEDFTYIIFEYDESYTGFFNELYNHLKQHRNTLLEDRPLHIRVAATMLKWLQSLPKITQTTDNLDSNLLVFRNKVKRIEIDPHEVFNDLRTIYENSKLEIQNLINQLEFYFNDYLVKLECRIGKLININDLKEWVQISKSKHSDNLLLNAIESDGYVINIDSLSRKLIGVNIENWTEQTEIIFFNEFDKYLKEITIIEFDINKHIKLDLNNDIIIIHKDIELSTKGNLIINNISRILDTQGKFVSKEERDFIIYNLMSVYLK